MKVALAILFVAAMLVGAIVIGAFIGAIITSDKDYKDKNK